VFGKVWFGRVTSDVSGLDNIDLMSNDLIFPLE
jgi:hypothetical protein